MSSGIIVPFTWKNLARSRKTRGRNLFFPIIGKEYIFLLGDKRVYRRGIQTRTNFYFRDLREEGMMSNRAKRLSDRAKRGSDSVARLDSPSDRRSRKGVLSRKYKFFQVCTFLSWYTQLSSRGTHFFALLEFVQP